MTYIQQSQYKETLQKDLYIKKKFSVGNSNTPWVPKVDIVLNKIVCDLKDTATGNGSTIIRFFKNYGTSSQSIIFDAVFAANDVSQETSSVFSFSVNAGDEVTYSIISTTSSDPGGEAIISFLYRNS
jgi:hypothetical protein